MEKERMYFTSSIVIFFVLAILYIYFLPLNFLKFITWLGNNEQKLSLNNNECIVLAKFVE